MFCLTTAHWGGGEPAEKWLHSESCSVFATGASELQKGTAWRDRARTAVSGERKSNLFCLTWCKENHEKNCSSWRQTGGNAPKCNPATQGKELLLKLLFPPVSPKITSSHVCVIIHQLRLKIVKTAFLEEWPYRGDTHRFASSSA